MNAAFNLSSGCWFFIFLFLPDLKESKGWQFLGSCSLKQLSVCCYAESNMLWKKDEHDLAEIHVRERKEKKKVVLWYLRNVQGFVQILKVCSGETWIY